MQGNYDRRVRIDEGGPVTFHVKDYAYQCWQQESKEKMLPPAWVDINSLSPDAHLAIQGAVQPYIDNAISKTINIPPHFPFEKLADIYSKAYALGLKGCTIFRPNPITGSVLEAGQHKGPTVDDCC